MKKIQTANLIAIRRSEILLVKRSKDQEECGRWSLPGGTKHDNEQITDTLSREIEEELGVSIIKYELFEKYTLAELEKIIEAYYFFGEIANGIRLNKTELSAYKWFSFKDIPKKLAYSQNIVIADFLNSRE